MNLEWSDWCYVVSNKNKEFTSPRQSWLAIRRCKMEIPYSSEMGKGTDETTEIKAALGSNLWCEGTGWGKGAAEDDKCEGLQGYTDSQRQ